MAEASARPRFAESAVGYSAGASLAPRLAAEMLDVRANVEVTVADVEERAARVREHVRALGGRIVTDRSQDRYGRAGAEFTLRLPPPSLEPFLAQVGGMGSVRKREIVANDVSGEYRDLEVQLANLEATLGRLRELSKRADKTSDLLEIERELTRVGTEIDRVKGRRAFLADRVAFATVDLVLVAEERVRTATEAPPEAFVHPGIGVGFVHDFRGSRGSDGYVGATLSFAASRRGGIDVEGYRRVEGAGNGLDLLLVTAGGAAYSELFGNGRRPWLNPFVGLRAGYARRLDANEGVGVGVLGLEFWKGEFVTVDAQSRALLFVGGDEPAHLALSATLTASGSF